MNISNITLYDLMAQDLDVWVSRDNRGFNIDIDDENGNCLVSENQIHPFAADSFADFCRRYLASYDKLIDEQNRT
jgi:hypothetical protein